MTTGCPFVVESVSIIEQTSSSDRPNCRNLAAGSFVFGGTESALRDDADSTWDRTSRTTGNNDFHNEHLPRDVGLESQQIQSTRRNSEESIHHDNSGKLNDRSNWHNSANFF